MLDCSPHNARGAFRAQGAGAVAPIAEAIHLLAHHIGAFPDAAGEQLGGLKQRCADFAYAGAAEVVACRGLKPLPARCCLRQQIHHAPQGLQLFQGFMQR